MRSVFLFAAFIFAVALFFHSELSSESMALKHAERVSNRSLTLTRISQWDDAYQVFFVDSLESVLRIDYDKDHMGVEDLITMELGTKVIFTLDNRSVKSIYAGHYLDHTVLEIPDDTLRDWGGE